MEELVVRTFVSLAVENPNHTRAVNLNLLFAHSEACFKHLLQRGNDPYTLENDQDHRNLDHEKLQIFKEAHRTKE